jgi:hypothetical protein
MTASEMQFLKAEALVTGKQLMPVQGQLIVNAVSLNFDMLQNNYSTNVPGSTSAGCNKKKLIILPILLSFLHLRMPAI